MTRESGDSKYHIESWEIWYKVRWQSVREMCGDVKEASVIHIVVTSSINW